MNFVIRNDAAKSLRAFEKFSCHALKKFFGDDAQIHSYENSDNPAERDLDLNFGIDGFVVDSEGWAHNYASRVQFLKCGGLSFNTFTVRGFRPSGAKTEIDKLRHGQKVDEPKPEYHIQAYVDFGGRGAVVGIVETVELYQWITRNKPPLKTNRDGTKFYAVEFNALDGVRVFYVDESGNVTDITAKVKAAAA